VNQMSLRYFVNYNLQKGERLSLGNEAANRILIPQAAVGIKLRQIAGIEDSPTLT
jgi:hypothetical protein